MDRSLAATTLHHYYISLTDAREKKKMGLSESSYSIFLSVLEEYIYADYAYTMAADLAGYFKKLGWQVTEKHPNEFEITHRR